MSVVMTAMAVIVGTALAVITFVTALRVLLRARGLRRRLRPRYFATAAWFYATRRAVGRRLAGLGARIERRRERRLAVRSAHAQGHAVRPSPDRARRPERPVTT